MVPIWILEREGIAPDDRGLQGLVDFTLAWGYAESKIVPIIDPPQRSLNLQGFSSVIPQGNFFETNQWIESTFAEYRDRYFLSEGASNRFAGLRFAERDDDFKNEVSATFADQNPSSQLQARTVGFIAYRLRNNLFHGNKSLRTILDQQGLLAASAEGLRGLLVGLEPRLNPAAG